MNATLDFPLLAEHGNGRFELVCNFVYELGPDAIIVVPRRSLTNFASIPWLFRWLISPIDPTICIAAVIHDFLVGEMHGPGYRPMILHKDYTIRDERISWDQADAILRRVMADSGAPLWKRQLVYWAVRLHGLWKDWND